MSEAPLELTRQGGLSDTASGTIVRCYVGQACPTGLSDMGSDHSVRSHIEQLLKKPARRRPARRAGLRRVGQMTCSPNDLLGEQHLRAARAALFLRSLSSDF
ncbi:hypothetical protein PCASD_18827 [Puccinia coronata f. sp. avenae]|uniref:Uncharacterized protein n=1 Tax=Puccinia coronata f. sp. avenae TaxID=200324 RepID=A0A2N5S6C2_9BASI|nr:hypothetical protein PCASD_22379 [Puccinia coronata f. sp. avenae]PLW27284.1 hypothetical protein PCASD_18827 [Puccinia coronata f. sp. avenae]